GIRDFHVTGVQTCALPIFDLPPGKPLYLLIPAAQHVLTVRLDGRRVPGTENQPWSEPAVGSSYVLQLPPTAAGSGVLEITLARRSEGRRVGKGGCGRRARG